MEAGGKIEWWRAVIGCEENVMEKLLYFRTNTKDRSCYILG